MTPPTVATAMTPKKPRPASLSMRRLRFRLHGQPAHAGREPAACDITDACTDDLDRGHQRQREHDGPQHRVAKLRAGLRVGGSAAGVVVGRPGDHARAQLAHALAQAQFQRHEAMMAPSGIAAVPSTPARTSAASCGQARHREAALGQRRLKAGISRSRNVRTLAAGLPSKQDKRPLSARCHLIVGLRLRLSRTCGCATCRLRANGRVRGREAAAPTWSQPGSL